MHLKILKVGVPAFFFMLIESLMQVVNMIFIGQLGASAAEISGLGLGNAFTTILCMCYVGGFNTSVETLVAQSFGA